MLKEFVIKDDNTIYGEENSIVRACRKATENNCYVAVRKLINGRFINEFSETLTQKTIDFLANYSCY